MDDFDVRLLHAVADPVRLAILRELSAETSVCACDFRDCCTTVVQSTMSHHLKVLREAGWVAAQRCGTNVSYAIRPEAAERFAQLADEIRPGAVRTAGELSGPVPQASHAATFAPDSRSAPR